MRRCKWPQISLNFQVFVTLRAFTPIPETTMACLKIKYPSLSDYHLAKLMVLCFKEVYDTDPNCIIYTCPSTLSYVSSFSPLWVYTFPPPVLRVYLLFLFFLGFEPFARRDPIHSIVFWVNETSVDSRSPAQSTQQLTRVPKSLITTSNLR